MGIRGFSIGSIVVILLIVILFFGTKRLRSIGEDLGSALKGFLNSFKDEDNKSEKQ